jgi:hypothetical protein
MKTERYFVGPKLLGDMRDTISRVQGSAYRVNGGSLPGRPESINEGEGGGGGARFRMATFTGSWAINASKVVTFSNQTNTPNTVSVKNELISLPSAGTRKCAIAREASDWYLVNWQWDVVSAATSATLTATSLRFDAVAVGALSTTTSSSFSVAVATCATATAS